MVRIVVFPAVLLLSAWTVAAQSVGPGFIPFGVKQGAAQRVIGDEVCATPSSTFPQTRNNSYSLDTDAAAHLGITYIGTGNTDLDRKLKVFIREVARYGTCTSKTGNSVLQMGAVWRATVLVDQTNVTGQVNFAIVAASSTLSNRTAQVMIESAGFLNQAPIDQASQLAMKETVSGLNVSTFMKFSEAIEKAVDAALASAVQTPIVIGTSLRGDSYYRDALAAAFALQSIADEKPCAESIAAFADKSAGTEAQIRQTYTEMAGSCGAAPSAVQRERAKEVLKGIQIRQR